MAIEFDGNIRRTAIGIVAAWLTLGLPWAVGVYTLDQARPLVRDSINDHAKTNHPDVRDLETQQARVEEKVNAIDDKLDTLQGHIERLLDLQLDRT